MLFPSSFRRSNRRPRPHLHMGRPTRSGQLWYSVWPCSTVLVFIVIPLLLEETVHASWTFRRLTWSDGHLNSPSRRGLMWLNSSVKQPVCFQRASETGQIRPDQNAVRHSSRPVPRFRVWMLSEALYLEANLASLIMRHWHLGTSENYNTTASSQAPLSPLDRQC